MVSGPWVQLGRENVLAKRLSRNRKSRYTLRCLGYRGCFPELSFTLPSSLSLSYTIPVIVSLASLSLPHSLSLCPAHTLPLSFSLSQSLCLSPKRARARDLSSSRRNSAFHVRVPLCICAVPIVVRRDARFRPTDQGYRRVTVQQDKRTLSFFDCRLDMIVLPFAFNGHA